MSTLLRIPAGEAHVVRVFAVVERPEAPLADEAVLEALGATGEIRTAEIELFDIADLQGMALSDYLREGHGIGASDLAPMHGQLDGLKGRVLILPSRAFAGKATDLRVGAGLRLVGRFTEEVAPVRFEPLPDGSTRGVVALRDDKRPRRQRAALWLAFGFFAVMAGVVALVIGLAVRL